LVTNESRYSAGRRVDPLNVVGYRAWYRPIGQVRQNRRIFVTDFETMVYRPDDEEDNEEVSGLLVYFLDEDGSKNRAFVNHAPYFYLLVEQNLDNSQRRELSARIDAISEDRITRSQWMNYADADDLVFFSEKEFIVTLCQLIRSDDHSHCDCVLMPIPINITARLSEITWLELDDVDLDNGYLHRAAS